MKFFVLVALSAAMSPPVYANFEATETSSPSSLIGQEIEIEILPDDVRFTELQEQRLEEVGYIKVRPVRYAGMIDWIQAMGERKVARIVSLGKSATSSFEGLASYYGGVRSRHKAEGVNYTAAHRTLPFGTKVRVTHNGKSVIVLINDRGPFIRGRVIDVDTGAARALGLIGVGVGRVTCEVM